MSKRDDLDFLYSSSKQLEQVCFILFCINTILALCSSFGTGLVRSVLILGQVLCAVLYMILKLLDDGVLWYEAESSRRKQNIQNAFNVQLSEYDTVGYYNNNIKPSALRYAMNTFESNFFSNAIAGKMLSKSIIKALVSILTLISTIWVVTNGEIILLVAQTALSIYVIEDTVMLILYKLRMGKLYDEAYSAFVTIGIKSHEQVIWLIYYIVEYEAVKAHYKIRLDSDLFNKFNPILSRKWESVSQKVNIASNEIANN